MSPYVQTDVMILGWVVNTHLWRSIISRRYWSLIAIQAVSAALNVTDNALWCIQSASPRFWHFDLFLAGNTLLDFAMFYVLCGKKLCFPFLGVAYLMLGVFHLYWAYMEAYPYYPNVYWGGVLAANAVTIAAAICLRGKEKP